MQFVDVGGQSLEAHYLPTGLRALASAKWCEKAVVGAAVFRMRSIGLRQRASHRATCIRL